MARREDLEPQIIELWLQRFAPGDRKMMNVLMFHGWLSQHRSDLLSFRASGDKYQVLKTILRRHIED